LQIHAHPNLYAAALIAGAVAMSAPASGQTPEITSQSFNDVDAARDSTYPVQTSPGAVTLELQPRWEDGTLFVEVLANTHTEPLNSLDLAAQVRLIIGTDSIAPDRAGALSGHHSSATLEFRLKSRPAEFAIEIRDVPDVPLRALTWPGGAEAEPD